MEQEGGAQNSGARISLPWCFAGRCEPANSRWVGELEFRTQADHELDRWVGERIDGSLSNTVGPTIQTAVAKCVAVAVQDNEGRMLGEDV